MHAGLICQFVATNQLKGSLADYQGKWVVLYFYPKDATPGCTQEGQDFRDLYSQFKMINCEVFGISRDSLNAHHKFKEKESFPFELISDADEDMCQAFNVIKEKNMYGKKVFGIERSTFIIDPQGKIAHEWRGVKVPGHVQEVLDTLIHLQKG
jgi:peroxiredoxin Q/BCP